MQATPPFQGSDQWDDGNGSSFGIKQKIIPIALNETHMLTQVISAVAVDSTIALYIWFLIGMDNLDVNVIVTPICQDVKKRI